MWARFVSLFNRDSSSLVVSFEPKQTPPPDSGIIALPNSSPKSVDVFDAKHVGGKGMNLLKLRRCGATVPAFLIIPTSEYETVVQRAKDASSSSGGESSSSLALAMENAVLSKAATEMIKAFVGPDRNKAYAVRSSADCEDGHDSAFAGQFDSILNVHSVEGVIEAVKKCYASMFSETVQTYISKRNLKMPMMAVVIMEQIDSVISGVYFQANPVTGATSTHVVNAALGQGEGVVSGLVESDEFWMNAHDGSVKKRVVVTKTKRMLLTEAGDGTREVEVNAQDKDKPVLTDAQLAQLFEMSKSISKAKKAFNSPQDIEWAFDASGTLFVLQSRPITTRLEHIVYQAPNVGLWRLNAHVSIPMSKLLSPVWRRGWGEGVLWLAQVQTGSGFVAVDTADVNGFGYFCLRMPGPKAPPKTAPPAFALRNMLRLVGRKDAKTAEKFFREKAYLDFVNEFKTKLKDEWIAKHRALQTEDPEVKSDAELVDYLRRAGNHFDHAFYCHVIYTLAVMLPHCWFTLWCRDNAKVDVATAYATLEGYSPVSEGIKGEFKSQIARISASAPAMTILNDKSLAPDTKLAKLMALSDADAGDAVREIIRDVEYRLVDGYDPANAIIKENPRVLVSSIANAVIANAQPKAPVGERHGIALREKIPQELRTEYDAMLKEMREIAFLRDERALYTDLWAAGILHRVVLAVADRLIKTQRLPSDCRALSLEAYLEELVGALLDPSPISQGLLEEWKRRNKYRFSASIRDAPLLLGGNDINLTRGHFPTEWMWRSYITSIESVKMISTPDLEDAYVKLDNKSAKDASKCLLGLCGSPGIVEGRARVVKTSADCSTIEKGEIIITESPSSLINMVLPLASGIACDFGGTLSHAAVCAREEGIPCVIGIKIGTVVIKTGDMVKVDGTRGVVEVL